MTMTSTQIQTKTKLCEGVCDGIACDYCWSFKIPKHILNATTNISIDNDEHLPLTISNSHSDNDNKDDINQPSSFAGNGCNAKSKNSLLNNNHLSYTSDQEDIDEDDNNDVDIDVAHTNTKQPRKFRLLGNWQNNRQQAQSRYDGYSTLGRVSMHDTWDDKDGGDNSTNREDDVEECNGEFISYWETGDVDSDDSSFCSTDKQINLLDDEQNPYAESDNVDDDRVETTLRPIPLFQRRSGGLGNNTIHPSSPKQFGWFQREMEANVYDNNNNNNDRLSRRRRRRGPWGWLRRQQAALEHEFDNSEDEGDHNIEENVLLDTSSCSDENGHYIMTPDMSEYDRALSNAESNVRMTQNNNIFGNSRRDRRGILALPIVRPFLRERSSPRGYMDNTDILDDDDDRGEDDRPSSQDHAAMKQSITQGIAGTNCTLNLDANDVLDIDDKQTSNRNRPPNLIERIFITRFLQSPEGEDNRNDLRKIRQLHRLLRRENWNLATDLLESHPELAKRWHNVDRLYGGRYDGEALPIHASCALHPPSSFIKMLGNLYPEGLLEKDKAFGRIPLHVACRSLADSSVIRVLCEMEPHSIDARDSLKRVPLHYLIKNYTTFGNDDDEVPNIDEDGEEETDTKESDSSDETNVKSDEDGMIALLIIIKSNPNCLHAADHRGWLPLHVACSCSSRKGVLRVLRLLLKTNPESINSKTDKKSDVFDCVNMAGKHHPTKDTTIAILKEAKSLVEDEESGSAGENMEDNDSNSCDNNSVSSQVNHEQDEDNNGNGDADDLLEDTLSNPQAQVVDLLLPDEEALSLKSSNEQESEDKTKSSSEELPKEVHCPEAVLLNI